MELAIIKIGGNAQIRATVFRKGIEMSKTLRLGENIRALRNAYGETQEELGTVIHVEKTTISNYEKGIRRLDNEIVKAIAEHYMVSSEELMYSDLSEIGMIAVDKDAFFRHCDNIVPIIESEVALQNEHFKKANLYHKKLYNGIKKKQLDEIEYVDEIITEYDLAADDVTIRDEASANLIGIYYLLILFVKFAPRVVMNKPAALLQIAEKDRETKTILENIAPDFENDMEEAAEALSGSEMEDELDKLRTTLKKSSKLSDLADYYLALQYVWNIVNNELNFEFNQRIGMEMMNAFISVGNVYAARFLKIQMESVGRSSQTVDDSNML